MRGSPISRSSSDRPPLPQGSRVTTLLTPHAAPWLASLNDLYATVAKTEVERRVAITHRREDRRRRASCTLDDLHPVVVWIAHEAQPRAALADRVRRALRLDALLPELRQRRVEVRHADRDVTVSGAVVVRTAVVVQRQLQHVGHAAHAEEVVGGLELAVSHDRRLLAGLEAERGVKGAAALGIGDPHHGVKKRGHDRMLSALTSPPACSPRSTRRRPRSGTPPAPRAGSCTCVPRPGRRGCAPRWRRRRRPLP